MIKSRNIVSTLVIVAMVASIFCLPMITGNDVDAAAKKVKITFKANGGKFTAKKYASKTSYSKKISKTKKGKKIGKLPKITKTGYTFKGWYTNKTKGKKVTAKTKLKKKTTLYARWSINNYTVTFDANGGNVSPASKSVTYNSTYGTLPTPSRIACDFLGWYTSPTSGSEVTSTTKYTSLINTTLYARWDDTYAINPVLLGRIGKTLDQIKSELPTNFRSWGGNENYVTYTNDYNTFYIFPQNAIGSSTCVGVFSSFNNMFPKLWGITIPLETFESKYGNFDSLDGDSPGGGKMEFSLGSTKLALSHTTGVPPYYISKDFRTWIYTVPYKSIETIIIPS